MGESILAWTRYRKGSTLDDIITDTSAEVVIARSWDGLNWSVPEVSSPRDEKRRQMDLLPFVFTDAATRQLYLSWTSSRSNSLGNILLRNMASEQSVYSLLTTERTRDYSAKIAPTKIPRSISYGVGLGPRGKERDLFPDFPSIAAPDTFWRIQYIVNKLLFYFLSYIFLFD